MTERDKSEPSMFDTVLSGFVFLGGEVFISGIKATRERAEGVLRGEETLLIGSEIATMPPKNDN